MNGMWLNGSAQRGEWAVGQEAEEAACFAHELVAHFAPVGRRREQIRVRRTR